MLLFEGKTGVCVLVCLYFLQGFPFGFATGALPLIIKASFTEAGFISLATYPYAVKVLWSPIVDSFWTIGLGSLSLGRRKSWIVPCTLLSVVPLLKLATILDELMQVPCTSEGSVGNAACSKELSGEERTGLVWGAIVCVFSVNLMMATQDVVRQNDDKTENTVACNCPCWLGNRCLGPHT